MRPNLKQNACTMLRLSHIISLLFLLQLPASILGGDQNYTRTDFPADFIFGSGTTAAQYEGAAFEDGRSPSIWDTFAHSGHTGGATADVACDGYHKYKGDVGLMVDTALDAFRISISWSRILPDGRGTTNAKGVLYYNNLINELVNHGIEPHVTLNHLDSPQAIEDEYGGWLSRKIVKDFAKFADVCFREFGDRVRHWTTINEINIAAAGGYNDGLIPPGRCSNRVFCAEGDGGTETYIAGHHMLLAHSAVAKLYKENYKATQNGYIGINVYSFAMIPYTNSIEDVTAVKRGHEFYLGWMLDPLIFGDYPDTMKKIVQTRLPSFTKQESQQIKGSVDFIGVNHYTIVSVKDNPGFVKDKEDYYADMSIQFISMEGTPADLTHYTIEPYGLELELDYLKQVYGNPPIYIHENGQITVRNGTLDDTDRVEYIQAYVGSTLNAIRSGSNVKGYFAWTFLDCLELLSGWKTSFGFYYVDLDDKDLARYPKLSAHWYSNFLRQRTRPNTITQVMENFTAYVV